MFTVLGTWEVIGEVQGERYTAINIHSSGREMGGGRGGARSSMQEEKCKQRRAGWHRAEIFLLSVTENLEQLDLYV